MRAKLLVILFFTFLLPAFAQVITWEPPFPMDQDSITVIFNAAQGNQGLMGYTGDVYAHTGVLTNLSPTPSAWRYVKTSWGQNTPETKLERIGTDLYRFKIKPSVRAFYGVPSSEQITNVCFVFRSGVQVGGSYLEGKTESGGDIFLPLFGGGLNVAIVSPSTSPLNPLFTSIGDTITVEVISSHSDALSLFINDSLVAQTNDSSLIYDVIVNQHGKFWVKAEAFNNNLAQVKADSFYFVVNSAVQTAALPGGVEHGINYINSTTATLVLNAPLKDFVYVIGDFTNWEVDPAYYMKKAPNDSLWWITVSGLTPQQEYIFQYFVDGQLRVGDPYSEKISDPWNDHWISNTTYPNLIQYPAGKTTDIASVLQTAQQPYNWQVTNFTRPAKTDLVIYELLIRDFLASHDYSTLIDTINYLKNLGVNAIELMPIMEFGGNESWGYNPNYHMAPDKYYGTKNKLKEFIDVCHQNGIAVILDIALNHIDNSPLAKLYWDAANNRPSANNPWLNPVPKHPFNVFNDFNHESSATKYYVDRVNEFWITEYKIDGYRFDLSKGFTQTNSGGNVGLWGQYDQSRINLLKRMADKIWDIDPGFFVILEHFAENSEETVLSNYGMMLWGNMNHQYLEAAMGYGSNLSGASYKSRGWSEPNLIAYMESHDEERMMFKNLEFGNSSGSYNIKDLNTALERVKLASAFYYTIPGPKMLWQFGELGYDVSIDVPCRTCNKPIRWNYWDVPARRNVYKAVAALIKLKNYDAFRSSTFTMDVGGYAKKINITHSSMNVAVIGNFDVNQRNINPNFSNTGWWYDYFSGDSINVSDTQAQIALNAGEFHIYTTVKLPTPEPGIINNVDDGSIAVVNDFMLEQNYPNPFNPSTEIIYHVKETGKVSIKIFDLLGREVKTLISEDQAPGIYSVTWNGDNNFNEKLSTGVYFYKMEAGSFVETKKMLMIK